MLRRSLFFPLFLMRTSLSNVITPMILNDVICRCFTSTIISNVVNCCKTCTFSLLWREKLVRTFYFNNTTCCQTQWYYVQLLFAEAHLKSVHFADFSYERFISNSLSNWNFRNKNRAARFPRASRISKSSRFLEKQLSNHFDKILLSFCETESVFFFFLPSAKL